MAGMSVRDGRRMDTVKSWAERSVWSLVCAMELGLISDPCLTSVSFATLSDDRSLVKTPMPNEFPSINSTIETASRPQLMTGLAFPARTGSQRRGRKPSSASPSTRLAGVSRTGRVTKSTTTGRKVRAGWTRDRGLDPGLDRAANPTVANFWRSCKRIQETQRKRPDRNCGDADDRFPDQPRSVVLAPGICYRTLQGPRRRGDIGEKGATVRSSGSAARGLDPTVDHQLRRGNAAKLVAEGRAIMRRRRKRRPKRKMAARIVENAKSVASEILPARDCEPAVPDLVRDAILDEDRAGSFDDERWECGNSCRRATVNSPREDGLWGPIASHDYERSSPSDIDLATGLLPLSVLEETRDMEGGDVEGGSSPQGSFLGEEQTISPDDVDALPLAKRIFAGSKCTSEEDEESYSAGSGAGRHSKHGRTSSTGSRDSYAVPADARTPNERDSSGDEPRCEKPRRRSGARKLDRDSNDYRSKDECGGESEDKVAAVKKRIARNGVVTTSLKDPARTDTIRAKIFKNDEEYCDIRRVTRGSTRISKENFVGKLVWGCCSGWWPALIIDADHVGMLSEAGKLWVYWIGEARISLLNEKTQIESFSCNLKYRLTQASNVARVRAIDATMQMLRGCLGCTLTKPYSSWIENNFSDVIEMIDEIKFYPYPARIQQRLAYLKEKNAKVTEKYLLDQKRESQPRKIAEKPKEPQQPSDADLTRLPLGEQNPGVITWAKIAGHNWWPAMIIDYRDCCMREPSFGCQWIMWYGDYKLSEVHHQSFLRFEKGLEKMRDYINNTKKHAFLVGVLQASKDYCFRMGHETDNWTHEDVFKCFLKMNRTQSRQNPLKKGESAKIYDKYSTHIVKKLNELKNNPNVDDQRADDIQNSDDLCSVMNGKIPLESLCLKCLKNTGGPMETHPFFEGSLCIQCSEQYKPCMFVFGNDAKCFYCTICAATGTVIICDNEDCPRVYCTACMKHLLCPTTYEQVLMEDPWECFLCKSRSDSVPDTVVRPRSNWKDKIIDMFRTNGNPSVRVAKHTDQTRRIRVLSLFDGLSTERSSISTKVNRAVSGLLVLRKLGLIVDVYYASEIDPDALMVSATHFGDRIVHLGDVKDITKEKIKEMAPIDLLIGGSPCNDLSLANPARLGLYDPKGTGILFFEYCRIMKLVKKLNNGRHLFWLYENVASMPSEYRLEMNKHLGQEPDVIDSADFSPQHRLRLYWHNLPIEPHSLSFQGEQDVQDILTPHCQRYALVKKIRTVTTKVNSLKQGKLALKPILMKDASDSLWITELEEIFGFPRHYTDVKNLSATKRQRLIGKSWSVQTLTAIFKSLCPYFECNAMETDFAAATTPKIRD
nr:uncharacterized protein LOC116427656 isoform X1 [Nomia melanderi]XP_031834114.1 uncharacterized protein LOC116427656 isoform X1 [Nomia melanderi]